MALSAGSVEIRLFAELARLQSDMKKANKVVEDAMGGIQKTVRATTSVFNNLAGAFGAAQIIKIADDYKRFDAQLKLSTKSLREYGEAYDNVIRIGRTAQSDIGAIGVLYARLNNNLRDFNVTQNQVADVTETISLALRTNNATVQETNSVMLQLSQSFGSGKLNGQEFLAVAEGAPMLLRQLATSLKVPFGALKDLSAQGKITREDLLKAWSDPAYIAALREQVKEVGTLTSAMTVFMNNLKQYVGEADKATGITKTFSQGIILVAENLNYLAGAALAYGAVQLVKWTQAQLESLRATQAANAQKVIAAKVELSLAQAMYASGAAVTKKTLAMANNAAATTIATSNTARLIAAQQGLAAVTSTAGAALRGIGTVLSAFGGWVGLAVTGVILFGDKILALIDRVRGLTPELKALNDEMERRNKIEKAGISASSKSAEQEAALVGQVKLYNEINAQIVRQKSLIESRKGFGLSVDKETKALSELEKRLRAQSSLMGTNITQANQLTPAVNENAEAFTKLSERLTTAKELANEYAKNQALIIIEGTKAGLTQSEITAKLVLLKEQYDKATGATKAHKAAVKEEDEALKAAKKAAEEYAEFLNGLAEARRAVIVSAVEQNEQLRQEIESTRNATLEIQLGEQAYAQLELTRLADTVATAEQIVAQGKLNGLTGDALVYAEAYVETLKEQLKLRTELTNVKIIKKAAEAERKAIEETEKVRQKSLDDLAKEQERITDNFSKSLTDALFRGFENGKSFAENFKDGLINSFKTLILRPTIEFVVNSSGLNKILGTVGTVFSGGASAGGLVDGNLAGGGSIFKTISDGLSSLNTGVVGSIEKLGAWFATGNGGFGDMLGGAMGQYANQIAGGLAFSQAAMSLLSGNFKQAAFEGTGTAIGLALGGPVGGAVGSFLGGAVGGLFGGKKATPRYSAGVSTTYQNGDFQSTSLSGIAGFNKQLGTQSSLTALAESFSKTLGGLLSGFGLNQSIETNLSMFKRKGSWGFGNVSIDGQSAFNINGGANGSTYSKAGIQDTFNKMTEELMGKGIATAIQSTQLPEGIKRLFAGLTDKTQVSNMIIASLNLKQAEVQLNKQFGLTVDQAGKVSVATGLVGDELSAFANKLATTANGLRTVGEVLIGVRTDLIDSTGLTNLPTTLKDFDSILKGIDKTTESGIESFTALFNLREQFVQFTTAIDTLKTGVSNSIFEMLTPAEQQIKRQQDLAKMFNELNIAVPTSVQELIAIGESIDYTTTAGLDLASVFPTLVSAFNDTQKAVDSLVASLNPDRFSNFASYAIASANVRNGVMSVTQAQSMPSYDVGTSYVPNDGVAMLHQGEAVITRSDNESLGANTARMVTLISSLVAEVNQLKYEMKRGADGSQRAARELEDITGGDVVILTQAT